MDNSTMQNLFGPLSKKYCLYFYILSIIGMGLLVFLIVFGLFVGIIKGKEVGFVFYFHLLVAAFAYAMFYFQNRLLHTMCASSL